MLAQHRQRLPVGVSGRIGEVRGRPDQDRVGRQRSRDAARSLRNTTGWPSFASRVTRWLTTSSRADWLDPDKAVVAGRD
jgi:hypothetical protein